MKISYDREADVLYIRLTDNHVFESEEKQPNVVFDYDENNEIVGIEFTYFLERYKKDVFRLLKKWNKQCGNNLQWHDRKPLKHGCQ